MKVLLPTDGSECSFSTLQWAAETLDKNRTQYYLLYVVSPLPAVMGLDATKTIEFELEFAAESLKRAEAELRNRGCTVEKIETLTGDPEQEICAYAAAISADQVILGSHGKSGLSKLILGSVSAQILEHCKCPVTIHRDTK